MTRALYKNPVRFHMRLEASELRSAEARAEQEGRDVNSYLRSLVRKDAESGDRRVIKNRNHSNEEN